MIVSKQNEQAPHLLPTLLKQTEQAPHTAQKLPTLLKQTNVNADEESGTPEGICPLDPVWGACMWSFAYCVVLQQIKRERTCM